MNEFELVGSDDVVLHFGKHKNESIKDIATSFKGMMYIRWLYCKHTRITEEVKDRIKILWEERKDNYIVPDRSYVPWDDDLATEKYSEEIDELIKEDPLDHPLEVDDVIDGWKDGWL